MHKDGLKSHHFHLLTQSLQSPMKNIQDVIIICTFLIIIMYHVG